MAESTAGNKNVSTATFFSESYYLRSFYKNNTALAKKSGRSALSTNQLSYGDSLALGRAARSLRSFDFNSEQEGTLKNVRFSTQAFTETYNNLMNGAKKTHNADIKRYASSLKNLMNSKKSDLEKIGIKMNSDGTITLNKNLLNSVKIDKFKQAFGSDPAFTKQIETLSKRMSSKSSDAIYADLTGSGQNITYSV